jgi:PhzF family phenazine biosynthesis protein
MPRYAFRLLNVFAESTFGGNQLAVFEDGRGLDDATMQAIGRQFNLSEITFLFPDETDGATARFRIFTPDYEMPFAGHPSLGTAQVVRELYGPGNELTLRCQSGVVRLAANDHGWSLIPPRSGALSTREADPAIAGMLGLDADALAGAVIRRGHVTIPVHGLGRASVRLPRPRARRMLSRSPDPRRGAPPRAERRRATGRAAIPPEGDGRRRVLAQVGLSPGRG